MINFRSEFYPLYNREPVRTYNVSRFLNVLHFFLLTETKLSCRFVPKIFYLMWLLFIFVNDVPCQHEKIWYYVGQGIVRYLVNKSVFVILLTNIFFVWVINTTSECVEPINRYVRYVIYHLMESLSINSIQSQINGANANFAEFWFI